MKVESKQYKKSMDACLFRINKEKESKNLHLLISEISVGSMVPLYAVYIYVIDLVGPTPELIKSLMSVCKFYQYAQVFDYQGELRCKKTEDGKFVYVENSA